jgi:hypothetical protein
MPLADLLAAKPETVPGIARLSTALALEGNRIRRELDEAALSDPNPPPGKLEAIDRSKEALAKIDARSQAVSNDLGAGSVVFGPAFEQQVLELLFADGVHSERDLERKLEDTDAWDIAAWLDGAAERGLIVRVGDADETPLRRSQITDRGRESIGYPSAR